MIHPPVDDGEYNDEEDQDYRPRRDSIDAEDIAYVLGQCMSLDLDLQFDLLLGKLESEAKSYNEDDWDRFVMPSLPPVLEGLVGQLYQLQQDQNRQQQCMYLKERIQRFIRHIVSTYTRGYVGTEPIRPVNWARPVKGCGCPDCIGLDQFLADPNRETAHFPLAEPRRKHLCDRLSVHDHNAYRALGPYVGHAGHSWDRRNGMGHGSSGYGSGVSRESEYDVSTVKTRPPYTLVITKTSRGWQRQHAGWQTRQQKAARQIQGLKLDQFQLVLSPAPTGLGPVAGQVLVQEPGQVQVSGQGQAVTLGGGQTTGHVIGPVPEPAGVPMTAPVNGPALQMVTWQNGVPVTGQTTTPLPAPVPAPTTGHVNAREGLVEIQPNSQSNEPVNTTLVSGQVNGPDQVKMEMERGREVDYYEID